jgi:hypothetical protein
VRNQCRHKFSAVLAGRDGCPPGSNDQHDRFRGISSTNRWLRWSNPARNRGFSEYQMSAVIHSNVSPLAAARSSCSSAMSYFETTSSGMPAFSHRARSPPYFSYHQRPEGKPMAEQVIPIYVAKDFSEPRVRGDARDFPYQFKRGQKIGEVRVDLPPGWDLLRFIEAMRDGQLGEKPSRVHSPEAFAEPYVSDRARRRLP